MFAIPFWFGVIFMFMLGSILGSFLDVLTLRFHTGKSINGRSRCLSCGHNLSWFELFPLFSYALLRGQCRVCHSAIPARLFFMEVITGTLFVLAWYVAGSLTEVVINCLFVMLAIVITVYDLRHLVIPNVFVGLASLLASVVLVVRFWPGTDWLTLVSFVGSGLVASMFYASLWYVSRGRWIGLGDAKLVIPLGAMLSAHQTFSFVVLSFWVGAAISIILLFIQFVLKRGQTHLRFFNVPLTMKSELPFAPFLLIAFSLVYFFGVDVLNFFLITI